MNNTKIVLSAMLLFSVSTYVTANVIVDTKGIDEQKYHADMYECQQLTQQVAHPQTESLGHDVLRSTGKGALLGAAGGAISGGSGSKGAKVGAGIGLIGGVLKHGANNRRAEQNYGTQQQNIIRNCMVGRGYTVLN